MARQTPLLLPPTLEEIKRAAAEIGLPDREAIRFYNFYESKGWMIGKNKMCSFRGALENWKFSWEDRGGASCPRNGEAAHSTPTPGDRMIFQKEFERLIERMRQIKNGYGEVQSWTKADIVEYSRLRSRKLELKKILGITI